MAGKLYDALTPAELRIVRLLGTYGGSNKEIARKLDIAESTVKIHIRSLTVKVGLSTRTELALWAVFHELAVPSLNAANPRLPGALR
jgi:two-component system nitrate/nitrite response regulator NarL